MPKAPNRSRKNFSRYKFSNDVIALFYGKYPNFYRDLNEEKNEAKWIIWRYGIDEQFHTIKKKKNKSRFFRELLEHCSTKKKTD